MKASSNAVYVLSVSASVAALAGCSNGESQLAPPSQMPQIAGPLVLSTQSLARSAPPAGAMVLQADRRRSWMAPNTKSENLLYVADAGTNEVYVLTWPRGKVVGTLTGFSQPDGECADKAGDVWITNVNTSQIFEYAHGGTHPIATLNDPNQLGIECSVDPTTGNLAVANVETAQGFQGSVSVYTDGRGNPKMYTDPPIAEVYYLDYDNLGNLFLDGEPNPVPGFAFAELPKGSISFTNIALNENIETTGGRPLGR